MNSLTLTGVALRSGRFFFKSHAAVGLGIAAATAVIVGAFVVGDSVRGSLHGLVLKRLVNAQALMQTRTFFDPRLLDSLQLPVTTTRPLAAGSESSQSAVAPLIYLPSATVEHRQQSRVHRGSQVHIYGVDSSFWTSIATGQELLPEGLQADQVALGEALAAELQAQVGDELTLRFDAQSGIPADNVLGEREDTTVNLPRQKIVAILPDQGLGGFSFRANQSLPRNIFCALESLQDALDCEPLVNAALVLSAASAAPPPPLDLASCEQLDSQLKPKLEDYGLQLRRHLLRFPDPDTRSTTTRDASEAAPATHPDTIYDYHQLTSTALMLDDAVSNVVVDASDGRANRLLTYLGNTITKVEPLESDLRMSRMFSERSYNPEPLPSNQTDSEVVLLSRQVPYSTVVGLENNDEQQLREFTTVAPEQMRSPYCWINSWLADQVDAQGGDWVEIKYYEPETIEGGERERAVRCMVAGVVPLTEPSQGFRRDRPPRFDQAPTRFNDPHLTPEVPGLTDKDSISNWDAPFKLDLDLLQTDDDVYYEQHRLTPKLFLPLRIASDVRLFGSRFGHATAIRFAAEDFPDPVALRDMIETALLQTRTQHGFTFLPIRQRMLESAAGTTPFDMLFLSLSFFVIVAALLLVMLLFKLGIAQRASQLGLLSAQGFTPSRVRGLLLRELSGVAVVGAAVGVLLGLGYAWAMIAALQTWWVGAIATPFISFSFTPQSLWVGAAVGMLMSLLTIYFSLRKLSHVAPLQLLRGQTEAHFLQPSSRHLSGLLAVAGLVATGAVVLIFGAMGQSGMARAGSFFGSGMLLLIAILVATHYLLRTRARIRSALPGSSNLFTLAWSTIQRNPLRSSMTLGLLSVASFLIASMSVFHVAPDPRGYGGFNLLAESSQPIYRNISSQRVREEILGNNAQRLRDTFILPFRMRLGDDASCNNLFQVAQPTVLGVSRRLSQIDEMSGSETDFQWAAVTNPLEPWKALEQSGIGDRFSPIPAVLDQNTAAWSLKQGAALDDIIELQYGPRTLYFRTVGLLTGSVLQGKLMISEENFRYLFPEVNGYSFFMIRSGDSVPVAEVIESLEQGWSAEGLDVTSSAQTLAGLLGVQNTYLSAFQSLGALGLLLGTFGLVAVQLRSVLERRQELALMQAVGFSKTRIGRMLSLETALLLGGGLLIGCLASAVALVPYIIEIGPRLNALQPIAMLALVLFVGFIAAIISVRSALKRSILAGLRGE